MPSSMFRRAKLLIIFCAMEQHKTDLILFIWLKLRSPMQLRHWNCQVERKIEAECKC